MIGGNCTGDGSAPTRAGIALGDGGATGAAIGLGVGIGGLGDGTSFTGGAAAGSGIPVPAGSDVTPDGRSVVFELLGDL